MLCRVIIFNISSLLDRQQNYVTSIKFYELFSTLSFSHSPSPLHPPLPSKSSNSYLLAKRIPMISLSLFQSTYIITQITQAQMHPSNIALVPQTVKNMNQSTSKIFKRARQTLLPSIPVSTHQILVRSNSQECQKRVRQKRRFSTQIKESCQQRSECFHSHRKIVHRDDPSHQLKVALIKRCLKLSSKQDFRPMLNCKQVPKINKENYTLGENQNLGTIEVNKIEINPRVGKEVLNKKRVDSRSFYWFRPQKSHQIKKSQILEKELGCRRQEQLVPWETNQSDDICWLLN